MDITALKSKIIGLFKQGLTPIELTQSITISGIISTIPILGVSTFLLTAISVKKKLNLPIMLAQGFIMWPLQVALIVPFINIGETVFFIPKTHHSAAEIIASFRKSFFATLSHLSFELLCGFGGWLLTAVPFFVGMYLLIIYILKTIDKAKIKG